MNERILHVSLVALLMAGCASDDAGEKEPATDVVVDEGGVVDEEATPGTSSGPPASGSAEPAQAASQPGPTTAPVVNPSMETANVPEDSAPTPSIDLVPTSVEPAPTETSAVAPEPSESPSTSTTAPSDVACVTSSVSLNLSLVSMLVLFDRSSSMLENNKWFDATYALMSFLQSPESDGLGVGLRFYPDDEPAAGCNQEACDAAACAVPLIQSGVLSGAVGDPQELALVEAIEARDPWIEALGNPMHPVLGGGLDWARDFQLTHDGERAAVVLVTDGEPAGCDVSIDSIAGLAAEAFSNDGVQTYVIGLDGSNQAQLNQIAAAGGSVESFSIAAGENAEAELSAALSAIRSNILACDFVVSDPETGTLDPTKVNLEVATPDGAVTFLNVPSEEDCGDTTSWFFADGNERIELCEAACETVLSDPSNHVNLFFGCETEALPGTGAR